MGRAFRSECRFLPGLRGIPVVSFTSCASPDDLTVCVNICVKDRRHLRPLENVVDSPESFWTHFLIEDLDKLFGRL